MTGDLRQALTVEPDFRDQLRDALRDLRDAVEDPDDDGYVAIPANAAEVLLRAASAHATWMGVRNV